ncbi:VOC family protein [Proteiniphilum saccharofermentans]|nr:VOC family protein [Proteiniphilum saccharofermentans]
MSYDILGLRHITAISNNAKKNFDFYTNVLGLRLVTDVSQLKMKLIIRG